MSTILQASLSFISTFVNKYIDTGDRQFDMALSGLITISITTSIMYIVNKLRDDNFKNKILYHFWYRHKDPTDFGSLDYYYDNFRNIDYWRDPCSLSEKKFLQELHASDKKFYIQVDGIKIIPFFYTGTNMIFLSVDDVFLYIRSHKTCTKSYRQFRGWLEKEMTKKNSDEKKKIGNIIQTLTCKGDLEILGKINPKKTFHNLYYEQKDEVLEAITKFKNNLMYPDTIGMDNKLGILLYGPPGTGKTGTISACANFLNRDVIIIDFSIIKTCQQLDNILKPDNFDKYIYVFDEFDCILDVLVGNDKRYIDEEKEPEQDWSKILMVAEGEERKQILDMMKEGKSKIKNKEQPLNLGYLLRKLDGLEDSSGRFIIATTNNPQNINPALLRPGRFDIKLCLGNCSTQMYCDILVSFYKLEEKDRKIIMNANLKPYRWSPLQVINSALVHKNIKDTLQYLKN